MTLPLLVLILASFIAGAQNALAGGGSFLTFPALLYMGLDPRAANITSAIALFPGQITTGIAGRSMLAGAAGLSIRTLVILSLIWCRSWCFSPPWSSPGAAFSAKPGRPTRPRR
jgi:uncharacterized membrane protein YfcA